MKLKYTLSILLLFISLTNFAQRNRDDDELVPAIVEGVAYSLPRTGIRVTVEATQEKYFHGPYFQFAEALLGIENAPATDSESWTIKDIQIETFSEADPDQVYKAMGNAAFLLSLTESGTLAGINKEVESSTDKLVVSSFLSEAKTPDVIFPDLSLNPFFEEVEDSIRGSVLVVKSIEEKAQEAAHTITKLRKRRFKSLGNAYEVQLPDGDAYELMVDELGKLEDEYVALFIGKTYKETFTYSFDYIPGNNSVSGDVLFRVSNTNGVLPKTDLTGAPIVIDVKKIEQLASAQASVKDTQNTMATTNVFYRMPGKAEIQILNGINTMASTRADLAQFGTVAPVPAELLNGQYEITLHPKTGAIKSILLKQ